jgi:hypothetical protein
MEDMLTIMPVRTRVVTFFKGRLLDCGEAKPERRRYGGEYVSYGLGPFDGTPGARHSERWASQK